MTLPRYLTRLPDPRRLREGIERRIGIDARALAAFRILLGCALLFDVLHRSQDLVAFYADGGAYPRAVLFAEADASARASVHALSGEPRFQALLIAVAAAFAVAVIVGYRSRLAVALSLALLLSIHVRNPLVLNGADRLLREVLVLAVFLPLGSRWAIDASRRESETADAPRSEPETTVAARPGTRVVTPATAALLVYVVGFFANNGQHKLAGDTWPGGEALGYALGQDQMTILLGNHLGAYPRVLEAGTYGWLALVVGAPLLLVLSGRLRVAYVGAFLGAVAGLGLSMAVGLFPVVLTAVLVVFLPPRVWDRLETTGARLCRRIDSLARLRSWTAGARARVGAPTPLRSRVPVDAEAVGRRAWSLALVGLLVVVGCWTAGLLGVVDPFAATDAVDPDAEQWTMYAPDPSTSYGWYVVAADLETGETKDVLRDADRRGGPPPDAAETVPNFRWRKYLNSLDDSDRRTERFAAYACERADEQFEARPERVTVTYHYRSIDPGGEETPVGTSTRAETACSAAG